MRTSVLQVFLIAVSASFPAHAQVPAPGTVFQDCPDCPEMVVIPPGNFVMGSPDSETGRDKDEGPQHSVTITYPLAVGRFEVTRAQFTAFVADTGHVAGGGCYYYDIQERKAKPDPAKDWRDPGFPQADSHPVVCVNWDDAKAYAAWLARKSGRNYRLLSEAEWEYAARAGNSASRSWGDSPDDACRYANVADRAMARNRPAPSGASWTIHNCDDGHTYTAPVGQYPRNAFGLHDMIGNAWEWTEDCYNDSYAGAPTDGSAWAAGDCARRFVRGASWFLPSALRALGPTL